ncbi:MAG TPA: UDP-glucose 4-epimerase GalE [Ramlibacter sp.]|jgi:UDP-glucose-4-epimerase GalE|nr:UDP-glucose 4-epimerase GalE [Ramlibacter sp.]
MKTVLVVGGAGYIGSHMVLALRDAGYRVVVFDNLSRGHADAVAADRLVTGDLRSLHDLRACFAQERLDLVMHFAALAYVGESVQQPELYYSNNVAGALNLLQVMRECGVQRFVFSSTCATYGEVERVPIAETEPQRPINPYGRTKLMIEQALQDYGTAYGTQSVSLRYFNAAGADPEGRAGERHDPETHLIPLVLEEALRIRNGGDPAGTRLSVFGSDYPTRDGSCVRDYIHVSDLARAHLLAAGRLLAGDVRGAEAYNLANGQGFTVLEVIEAGRRITGEPIGYRLLPRREGDPPTLVGDASKASAVLGWTPKHARLDDIIATAWAWHVKRAGLPAGASA